MAKELDPKLAEKVTDKYGTAAGPPDEMGHVTRFSDSSIYDFVCVYCGATDCPWDNGLARPCPEKKDG